MSNERKNYINAILNGDNSETKLMFLESLSLKELKRLAEPESEMCYEIIGEIYDENDLYSHFD